MNNYLRLAGAACVFLAASSCISATSYVDSAFPDRKLKEITAPGKPILVTLDFQFRTNGTYNADAKFIYQSRVIQLLERTRVFKVLPHTEASLRDNRAPTPCLTIAIDNRADLDYARRRGAQIGASFGGLGGFVTDEYVMTAYLKDGHGDGTANGDTVIYRNDYQHYLHTGLGSHSPPNGLEPRSTQEAFSLILEQLIFTFVYDFASSSRDRFVYSTLRICTESIPGCTWSPSI